MNKMIRGRDMADEIRSEIRKSEKMRNATRLHYYKWAMESDLIGISSYETFINSWAGIQWFKKHVSQIQCMADELNRSLFMKNYKVEFPI